MSSLLMCLTINLNAQDNESISDDHFTADPFGNSANKDNRSRSSDDEIFSDTTNLTTPMFFDYLNSNTRINSTGATSDPGDNPDVPFDDYLIYLFIAMGIYLSRCHIQSFLNKYKLSVYRFTKN